MNNNLNVLQMWTSQWFDCAVFGVKIDMGFVEILPV